MKKLNIGLIGAGFMAKAHSMAYATMPMFFHPAPAEAVRRTICDVTIESAKEAAERYGFEKYTTDWRDIVSDPEIDVIDIATPNDSHAEIAIAAAKAGKQIISEKPLARTVSEAKEMYDAVISSGVTHMVAFNYRRTPAVALAKKYISEGAIGKVLNFRGTYLQDWSADPNSPLSWRFKKDIAGSGALGDIATHSIDMARYLVGEIAEVSALSQTYISERPIQSGGSDKLGTVKSNDDVPKGKVDVDDENLFLVKFENGAVGSIEATRNAWGRNNFLTFEIHGTLGSICFDYEKRDELQVCFAKDGDDRRGFKTVFTGPSHPYGESLWPIPALGIGYGETKIIETYDFFKSIVDKTEVSPNFEDGYKVALICDAIIESSKTGLWTKTNCNNVN
ncbi:Gfo/Idh/MocA family protein [Clostridium beijerinckii]|uniref:Gfo/Idh/MocA family oxidoreductase n=1 Tax=Clostridium beijerinckii TaxID=1520 RepID=A0AAW3W9B2_CLOBE|nr:Gfo/Idh/MocA family oxidoreductase [Clostridium beijerinckii]MBC2457740.1 Gfo/Idh/MocA family oxidoreductase [Clostridium beijerinckii]MBC2475068.1 Gfo/Idh/MocA family oxidoreductase [Clostridium beijerinckii]NOV63537.1 putative dehydrogenase [Clostridium beijerinckii]NOV73259.1 putative dehydrogenase [Clostridium beijerinckii]NOW35397.1 putative dehydrogenase [Clostridium beijerinckii]